MYAGLHALFPSILISFLPSEAMSLFAFWLVRLKTMKVIRFSVYTGLSLFLLSVLGKNTVLRTYCKLQKADE